MIFTETPVEGAFIIDLEPLADSRGFFARAFCAREFEKHGLKMPIAQANISVTRKRGTIRGFHYTVPPAAEAKLVRCVRGEIYNVIADIRRDSPSFLRHFAVQLGGENRKALFVPEMVANGFQTLTDYVEVHYLMSEFYLPEVQRGLRYNDPELNITWPLPVSEISENDLRLPFLADEAKTTSPSRIPCQAESVESV